MDPSPQRVTAGGQGASFLKVAVPATVGTEGPPSQHMLAGGGLEQDSSQHKLVCSANSQRSSDPSWTIEVIGAMGSTPKNGNPDSSGAGPLQGAKNQGAALSPKSLQQEFEEISNKVTIEVQNQELKNKAEDQQKTTTLPKPCWADSWVAPASI